MVELEQIALLGHALREPLGVARDIKRELYDIYSQLDALVMGNFLFFFSFQIVDILIRLFIVFI
mgnify:CR=1 FL=1